MKKKQVFLKYKNGGFSFLSEKEKATYSGRTYVENVNKSDKVEPEFTVSFVNEEDDIGVYFWVKDFSIGFKRDELLKVLDLIKDKDKLQTLIVTELI